MGSEDAVGWLAVRAVRPASRGDAGCASPEDGGAAAPALTPGLLVVRRAG